MHGANQVVQINHCISAFECSVQNLYRSVDTTHHAWVCEVQCDVGSLPAYDVILALTEDQCPFIVYRIAGDFSE